MLCTLPRSHRHVESLLDLSDQIADPLDGVGSIAIGNNDDVMLGRLDTVHQASPVPAIRRMARGRSSRRFLRARRTVGRPVVHNNDLAMRVPREWH